MFGFSNPFARQSFGHLSPRDIAMLPPTTRIVDVRERHEFEGELGHIPRAELVPLGVLAGVADSWPRHDDIVVVCRSGGRSSHAAAILTQLGFTRVRNLDGGMVAYARAGLPVERTS